MNIEGNIYGLWLPYKYSFETYEMIISRFFFLIYFLLCNYQHGVVSWNPKFHDQTLSIRLQAILRQVRSPTDTELTLKSEPSDLPRCY